MNSCLKYRDRLFVQVLATIDVRRHLPTLRELAKVSFPDTPLSRLGVTIDYFSNPMKIFLCSIEEMFSTSEFHPETVSDQEDGCSSGNGQGEGNEIGRFILVKLPEPPNDERGGPQHVIMSPKFLGGMNYEIPRLREGAKVGPKRDAAVDMEGRTLEVKYDEVDEIIRRIQDAPRLSAFDKIEEVLESIDTHAADWPFESSASSLGMQLMLEGVSSL